MKKSYLMLAAVAALFAACSSGSDDVAERPSVQNSITDQVPVVFDNYVNRATTRAGLTGPLDNGDYDPDEEVYTGMSLSGFGVFAYYTNADNYDQTFTPNFMYNQRVYNISEEAETYTWTYSPVKYWPNEFGSGAQSDDVDKVSFFAYAPYVTVNPTSGKVKSPTSTTYGEDNGKADYGIVGMKRNNDTGDPMVKYMASFYTDKQVDLVWGTADDEANVTWNKKNSDTDPQTIAKGLPWLNVEHPSATSTLPSDQKVSFKFLHALAALNVQVLTDVNKTSGTASSPPAETKVFIRSVTFEGFDTQGALNLNNAEESKAFWYNFDCLDELNNGAETTIKDGRKDGKEGLTEATKEYAAINPVFVQDAVWGSTELGVTEAPGNLFCRLVAAGSPATKEPPQTAPIYVIPNGDKLKVTIEYDVLTADANLAGKLNDGVTPGSVVKNVITRYITLTSALPGGTVVGTEDNIIKLENGKLYTITLRLGLNSVEFAADVKAWDSSTAGDGYLPHNN